MSYYKLSPEGKEVKKVLEQILNCRRLLESLKRRIAEAEQSISVSSPDYSQPVVQGGNKTTQQERYAERMEKLRSRYDKVMTDLFAAEDEIAETLEKLCPLEQSMIIDRYMIGMTWRKIAIKYGYEEAQTYRIHNKALNNFSKELSAIFWQKTPKKKDDSK